MARRKLPIDVDELAFALETQMDEAQHYLNLETGDLLMVTDEARKLAEEIVQSIPEDQELTRETLEAACEDRDKHDWQLEEAIQAALVEEGFGTRYVEVPTVESREAYRDMEDFIETVADPRLQRELERAIRGRGAFRRFKDVLSDYPAEEKRWFAFHDDIMRRRALEFLHDMGVEPAPRPPADSED